MGLVNDYFVCRVKNGDADALVHENSVHEANAKMNDVSVSNCKLKRQGSSGSPLSPCGNVQILISWIWVIL